MAESRRALTVLRRLALGGVVLALGAGGAFWLLRPPTVTVVEVARRDIVPAIQGVGTVEARVVVQVSAKITGRLTAVLVDQGDAVEAGRMLARLDDAPLRADVARSEAAVGTAEAQLRDLAAGARPEEIAEANANVRRTRAQLAELEAGTRRQELEELRERLRSAAASRTLAERELRRTEELRAKELIAAQELDRARQAHDVAAAQERAARQLLDMATEGPRAEQVEAARAQLRAVEERLALLRAGPRPHQVEAARAQVSEARAALALARSRLDDAAIVSSFDGYVVSRDLEPGATVNPGTPILKVADPRTGWVTVHVDERETGLIAVGDAAEISLRSLPGRALGGRVARIRRESDRVTEQLAVDIAFDERPTRLTLGEQVEATIRPAGRRGVVALPLGALVRTPNGPGALVVENGRLALRTVRPGVSDGHQWIEVLEGLRPGEQVVLTPGRLADPANAGRRVLSQPASSGAARASER